MTPDLGGGSSVRRAAAGACEEIRLCARPSAVLSNNKQSSSTFAKGRGLELLNHRRTRSNNILKHGRKSVHQGRLSSPSALLPTLHERQHCTTATNPKREERCRDYREQRTDGNRLVKSNRPSDAPTKPPLPAPTSTPNRRQMAHLRRTTRPPRSRSLS